MQQCERCKGEVQAQHLFCGNCGASIDIQQQATPGQLTVLTAPPSDRQVEGEQKSDSAYLLRQTPPKDRQIATPQVPNPGLGQFSASGTPQAPGLGMGQFSASGTPQAPGLGVGQFSASGTPQAPGLGAGQFSASGTPQAPGLGAGQFSASGAPQAPGLGAGQFSYPGAPQAPGLGAGQFSYPGIPQTPSSGIGQGPHPGIPQTAGLDAGQAPHAIASHSLGTGQFAHASVSHTQGLGTGQLAQASASQAQGLGASQIAGQARKATSALRKWATTAITTVVIVAVGTGAVLMNTHNNTPADNANFQVKMSVQGQYDGNLGPFENNGTLIIKEGNVCSPQATGQVQRITGPVTNGQSYSEDATLSCNGTYKGGQITYVETYISAVFYITDRGQQYTCKLLRPGPRQELSGNYTPQGNFSGNITVFAFPQSAFACSSNASYAIIGGKGSWRGTIT